MTISDAQSVTDGTAARPPQSLPDPEDATAPTAAGDGPAPAGPDSYEEIQNAITRIWEGVLRLDGICEDDDFFEMGGHSLAASQVISRMRESLRVDVSLAAFFDCCTIAELAVLVVRRRAEVAAEAGAAADGPDQEEGGH